MKSQNKGKVNHTKLLFAFLTVFTSGVALGLFIGILVGSGGEKSILAIKVIIPLVILEYFFWYKSNGLYIK